MPLDYLRSPRDLQPAARRAAFTPVRGAITGFPALSRPLRPAALRPAWAGAAPLARLNLRSRRSTAV